MDRLSINKVGFADHGIITSFICQDRETTDAPKAQALLKIDDLVTKINSDTFFAYTYYMTDIVSSTFSTENEQESLQVGLMEQAALVTNTRKRKTERCCHSCGKPMKGHKRGKCD